MSLSDASESTPIRKRGFPVRKVMRRVVYPLAVIAAIVGVIWWLEVRDNPPTSPTGERYGPAPLPAALALNGLDVAANEGSLAPDFLLETLDGEEIRLSDLRGQPVVLNFWATWCKPCRQEMPRFVEAYDEFSPNGLVIVAVNMQEGIGIARPFAEDFGMDFPIAVDRDGEVGERYRLLGLPTTVFVDRQGVVRSAYSGPFQEEQNQTNVQGAIAESEMDERIAEIVATEVAD
jgi:peroxiredoxin